jgi:hypothetical protein
MNASAVQAMNCGVVATCLTCLPRELSPAAASVLTIYLLFLSMFGTLVMC